MVICQSCFQDEAIKDFIRKVGSQCSCDFCGILDYAVEAYELASAFNIVFSLFNEDTQGLQFLEAIQSELGIFTTETMQYADRLFASILGQGWEEKKNMTVRLIQAPDVNPDWCEFSEKIKHSGRFFCEEPFQGSISQLVRSLNDQSDDFVRLKLKAPETSTGIKGDILYRARVNPYGKRYYASKLGAPPKEITREGRANPTGIPYLYLARELSTAISETRPAKGQKVSVGFFRPIRDLTIFRFGDYSIMQVIFGLLNLDSDDDFTPLFIREALSLISNKLSIPIDPSIAAIEYIPTQYICELIKNNKCDGVAFKSAMGVGDNIVLFNVDDAKAYSSIAHNVLQIGYTTKRDTK